MDEILSGLTTEQLNDKSKQIDMCNTLDILKIINSEDMLVPAAVAREIGNIEQAVDAIVQRIQKGGRLFYIGAGTSGRIGILDASECPPTFGTAPGLVQGVIAGGPEAVWKAVEGAEDNEELGKAVIYEKGINEKDAVIGITASGRTPYVIGAVREGRRIGALTIGISNNKPSQIKEESDIAITPLVGPEVIMGSTRMKSGTSQKLVLNMISTAVMIKLGKVYKNLMVDLQPTNKKLMERTVRIMMSALPMDEHGARHYLELSQGRPKVAIVMAKTGAGRREAERLLDESDGFIARAVDLFFKQSSKRHNV